MGIWNEGEMRGEERTQKALESRQFEPGTREPHCIASQCEMNVLLSMRGSINRNAWGLTSQSPLKSGHSQPNRCSCHVPSPDVFPQDAVQNTLSHKVLKIQPLLQKR